MVLFALPASAKVRQILKRTGKITIRVLLVILILFLAVVGLIQLPPVQNYIKDKVITMMAEKLHTTVQLGHIHLNFGGNVVLRNLFIADRQNDTVLYAGKLEAGVNPARLLRKELVFSQVSLSDATFTYMVLDDEGRTNLDFIINAFGGEKKEKEQDTGGESLDIKLKQLELKNTRFEYHNLSDSMLFNIHTGLLALELNHNNLDSMLFDVDRIRLQNTRARLITYRLTKVEEALQEEAMQQKSDTAENLSLSIRSIELKNVSFQQTDSFTGSGGMYTIGESRIRPEKIDLSEQLLIVSGIELKNGEVVYTGASHKENESPETEKSNSSWKIGLKNSNLQFNKIQLKNLMEPGGPVGYLSNLSFSDVELETAVSLDENAWSLELASLALVDDRTGRFITLAANATSDGKNITLDPARLRIGQSHIHATLQGNFSGAGSLPDLHSHILSSNIVMSDFEPYLPENMLASFSRIPSQFTIKAQFDSRNQALKGNGEITSEPGNIRFVADMVPDAGTYKLKVDLTDVKAGYFTGNPQLGTVTAFISAEGKGFKPDSMQTRAEVSIPSVVFNGVEYNGIHITGSIDYGRIQAQLNSTEPVASLAANISGTIGDRQDIRLSTYIRNADLNAMKLMEDTLVLSGNVNIAFRSDGKEQYAITADTLALNIRTPRNQIRTRSQLAYSVQSEKVEARIKSSFGEASYQGNVPVQEVPVVIKSWIERYFTPEYTDTIHLEDKFFRFAMDITDLSMISEMFALDIDIPEDARINAEFRNSALTSNVDIGTILFNNMEISRLKIETNGNDSAFSMALTTRALHNETHTLRDIALNGNLRNGLLNSRLNFSNAAGQKWFDIGARMEPRNPEMNLKIEEPLLLNHKEWQVDKDNLTYIRNDNVVFKDVRMNNGDMLISLLSDAKQPEKLAVVFKNLNLNLLSEILNGDTTFISGKIDGNLMATNLFAKPVPSFNARLNINDIILEKHSLGNLDLTASNLRNSDAADLDLKFGQDDMHLMLRGTYGLTPEIPMNLDFSTSNLNLAAIAPLMRDLITDAAGTINARVNLSGSFEKPVVRGEIGFDQTAAFVKPLQTKYALDKQRIRFNGNGVDFNRFTLKDADGSNLEINGKVEFADLNKLKYNLHIKSDEFLAYQGPENNLPGQDNKVVVTTDISVTGENNQPLVNATVRIDEGSRFFYKITKQASTLTEEGIIEFDGKPEEEENSTQAASISDNLNLTANIALAENTEVTIITDPVRNLGLNMEAGGTFSLSQRPYQPVRLTGRLDISGGDYTISLSGLKRRFEIADSSYIIWYGNMTEPELNLRAYYEVRTSPAELIDVDNNQRTSTLPFMVNMIISGSLEDPKFNFRLSLPREYEGVNNGLVAAKLQEINSNESDLNQKAMALLLFGSFGFDNIAGVFSNSNGANVIISNALNQLASQKLKFIDLHFDLESYDNYGGTTEDNLRTEMKVAASRKFYDTRLDVQLGSTFVLQADEKEQQQSVADKISPEFNIQYMLNKPRTVSISGFRRSEYRGLVEGKVISTGAGIQYQRDFNRFRELFRKPENTNPVADNQQNTDENE